MPSEKGAPYRPAHRPAQQFRLLDLRHASRLDAIERAFAALGKTISIAVSDAA